MCITVPPYYPLIPLVLLPPISIEKAKQYSIIAYNQGKNGVNKVAEEYNKLSEDEKMFVKAVVICGIIYFVPPLALKVIGFTPGGVAPNSIAAFWQSKYGAFTCGIFSKLQSIGATGMSKKAIFTMTSNVPYFLEKIQPLKKVALPPTYRAVGALKSIGFRALNSVGLGALPISKKANSSDIKMAVYFGKYTTNCEKRGETVW